MNVHIGKYKAWHFTISSNTSHNYWIFYFHTIKMKFNQQQRKRSQYPMYWAYWLVLLEIGHNLYNAYVTKVVAIGQIVDRHSFWEPPDTICVQHTWFANINTTNKIAFHTICAINIFLFKFFSLNSTINLTVNKVRNTRTTKRYPVSVSKVSMMSAKERSLFFIFFQ